MAEQRRPSSPPDDPTPSSSSSSGALLLQTQMDAVLNLLHQPTVNEHQVDQAVSSVLTTLQMVGVSPTTAASTASTTENGKARSSLPKQGKKIPPASVPDAAAAAAAPLPPAAAATDAPVIQVDTGNYDDDDTSSENDEVAATATKNDHNEEEGKSKDPKPRRRGRPRKRPRDDDDIDDDVDGGLEDGSNNRLELIAEIPMGLEACKMMTTFGDGKRPQPDAIEAALLGTRQTLQLAIMDARVLRRRLQQDFTQARRTLNYYINPKVNKMVKAQEASIAADLIKNGTNYAGGSASAATAAANASSSVDPKMLYRALADGKDRLSVQSKCGFDMEELTQLFPEEMRAYQRWNELHEAYAESREAETAKAIADAAAAAETKQQQQQLSGIITDCELKDETDDQDEEDQPDGGHLKERLAQFDVRTYRMKSDWYVQFAKVRQGSFLPRGRMGTNKKRTEAEKEWEEMRRQRMGKGRQTSGVWESIPAKSVRFLHWLGFDPPNLCPPEDEVTQALAFLAYDRLGRIVEKAIYLRNSKSNENDNVAGDAPTKMPADHRFLWEMPPGHQLSKDDIQLALQDPDTKPCAIYASDAQEVGPSIQLYFGDGFEDRLELEMEEMIAATTNREDIPSEEQKIRKEEAELLAKISVPPSAGEDGLEQVIKKKKGELQKQPQKASAAKATKI